MSEVRAGIVVTGTEVLTGRIADRNGPWISEQLAELGVDVAHILVVGDRPDDLEAALRFMAAEGMDLIVTSGGLGPTADDLTAEVVARFAGRELVLDEEVEEKIATILRNFARSFNFDEEAVREANRKQAMVPEGSIAARPGRHRARPGRAGRGSAVVVVLPGPPRELQPMWPAALATEPVRELLERATPLHGYTLRMFGIPESEIAKSLREIEAEGVALPEVEITTCLRRGEIEIDVRYRDGARDRPPRRSRAGLRGAPRPAPLQPRRRDDRLPGGAAARRAPPWPGRVLQRRPAGGADHQPAGRLGLHGGRRRLLLERGQGGAARRRPGADRGQGRRLARGGGGDGARRAGALRGRRRRSRSPASPAPTAAARRSRSATSASTPASPTAPRSPAIRSSPAAAPTSANARPWSACTCCASCSAARRRLCRPHSARFRHIRALSRAPAPRSVVGDGEGETEEPASAAVRRPGPARGRARARSRPGAERS